MKNYSSIEIEGLIKRFESSRLPKSEWTHAAHLIVAVWYGKKYLLPEALSIVRQRIIRHNISVGTPNTDYEGYHETITRFWLMVVGKFIKELKETEVTTICNLLIHSEIGKKDYPLAFYSNEVLFSVKARKEWVKPDLKHFIS